MENINKQYLHVYAKNECLKQVLDDTMGSIQSLRFKSMCSV